MTRGVRGAAVPAARDGAVAAATAGLGLAEAAGHFGSPRSQLVKDLELLFVCGTPGHFPDDLIDASWDSGRVFLSNADAISRPLRLGVDEAVALLAGCAPGRRARPARPGVAGVGAGQALGGGR